MKSIIIKNTGLLLIALLFAIVINIPDIYPALFWLDKWIPINSPPYSIGDDYFYFGILNKISANGISFPHDTFIESKPLSQEYIRILAYWINVPFYKLGNLIFDQRLGILFVRFFNAFFLYICSFYFFNKLFSLFKKIPGKVYTHTTTVVFFFLFTLFYPPYNSITRLHHCIDPSYIYNHGQFNDLTRAIFSGTTGALMLFAMGYLIFLFQKKQDSTYHFYIPLLLFSVFAFIHLPSAIVILFVSGLTIVYRYKTTLLHEHKLKSFVVIIVFGGIIILQKTILSSTEIAQELFNTNFDFTLRLSDENSVLKRIINIGIFAISPYITPIISLYFFRKRLPTIVFILFFALTLFSIGTIFQNTHYNRFWYRGAIIPYIAFSVFFVFQIIKYYSKKYFSNKVFQNLKIIALILIWGVMIVFFTQNASYLYKYHFKSTDKPELLHYILNEKNNDNLILTNSGEVIYYYNCYSNNKLFFQDYSFQPYGYKQNLLRAMENFALLGVTKEQFITLFTKHPIDKVSSWIKERPFTDQNINSYTNSYIHSLYFLSTYFTYNNKLLKDMKFFESKLKKLNYFIDYTNNFYPQQIRQKYQNSKFDIIIDQAATSILRINSLELFNYKEKIVLDKGKIIILKYVSI